MTERIECCDEHRVHEEALARVRDRLPTAEHTGDLAALFKVLGDATRMRILCALFESELCVCDIAALLGMTQSAISHQLRVLKQARLVRSRREGKTVYYFPADDHVRTIVGQGIRHIAE